MHMLSAVIAELANLAQENVNVSLDFPEMHVNEPLARMNAAATGVV